MSHLGIDIGGTKAALRLERDGAAAGAPAREVRFTWPEEGGAAADMDALVTIRVGESCPYSIFGASIFEIAS
ncbi:hypothetical protein ABZ651_23850, partial [Streptomyces sp. NPDC007070]